MPCSTCQKVKADAPVTVSGLPFTASSMYVTGKYSRRYSIATCLIPPMREPRNGWKVTFAIKGQVHEFEGRPRDIFLRVKRMFDLNEIPYTDLDLWLNLNIQWTSSAVERYQKVRHSDLMKIAKTNTHYDDQVPE